MDVWARRSTVTKSQATYFSAAVTTREMQAAAGLAKAERG